MPKSSHKTSKAAIEVQHLSVTYEGTNVLEDISFTLPQGSLAAIIGPNGSGKTTLVKALLGLVPLESGHVTIQGQNIHDARNAIGYVPQRFDFDKSFPITVLEFLNLSRHTHATAERIDESIKEVGLTPAVLEKQLGTLSGGQLQRVLIAQAILHNPSILVLDEPSAGIDVAGEQAFYDVIEHLHEEHDTTVLLVSHDISMVMNTVDQVICVNKELICMGPPSKALNDKTLRGLFGHDKSIVSHTSHTH